MIKRIIFFVVFSFSAATAFAQEKLPAAPVVPLPPPIVNPAAPAQETPPAPAAETAGDGSIFFSNSMMFTPLEILSIRQALKGEKSEGGVLEPQKTYNIPPIRRIILSGIVYRNPKDWIVWINNQKMTPDDVLPEVVSVDVHEDKIDLEWYDIGLNDIIKIRMRPHQIYDIVTGVLLPG